ncbi:F-type H+-transporting ATPase subunit b [Thermovibrio guaymasensis]|uniref:ATP synthase subunit b n=1 Tax=Thermovibrio guaymasensis TaxID=240167 RepID=A0A420W765_9BACT|nr:ATP synthase F0 subunit B [Thermovibrio guaymasensis]RKQ63156.1 F-type H+-transporting ATPase subunit b [Thermovibrio guaymasensis]
MEGSIVSIDWTLAVQAVNFLVFMVLINKFLFKPLLELMEEREREVGAVYSEVEALKEKANSLFSQVEELLARAKEEAKAKIDEAVREAREEREKILSEAQEEALKKVEKAKEEIWKSFEEEKAKLEKEAERIAEEIVKKILGKVA